MSALDPVFRVLPLAHRGLHDRAAGRIENSPTAFRAACDAGYGIELDVQLSRDGQAVVFHDDVLDRLTARSGPVRALSATDLGSIALRGSADRIPTLAAVLAMVAGRVPVLIEIKDQDGGLGPAVGALESAVAEAVQGYDGPLAVMSFNPFSVAAMARLAPDLARGLTTCTFDPGDWAAPVDRLADHAAMSSFAANGCSVISHSVADLDAPRVAELKGQGAAILCWTVTSPAAEARARQVAHNITFEGYTPTRL